MILVLKLLFLTQWSLNAIHELPWVLTEGKKNTGLDFLTDCLDFQMGYLHREFTYVVLTKQGFAYFLTCETNPKISDSLY